MTSPALKAPFACVVFTDNTVGTDLTASAIITQSLLMLVPNLTVALDNVLLTVPCSAAAAPSLPAT